MTTRAPDWRVRNASGRFTKLRWWQRLMRIWLTKVARHGR